MLTYGTLASNFFEKRSSDKYSMYILLTAFYWLFAISLDFMHKLYQNKRCGAIKKTTQTNRLVYDWYWPLVCIFYLFVWLFCCRYWRINDDDVGWKSFFQVKSHTILENLMWWSLLWFYCLYCCCIFVLDAWYIFMKQSP